MQLRTKQRATYGHHGTSIGKSRARSPQVVSALQRESEAARRKKLKESRLASSHRPGDKRHHDKIEKTRKESGPEYKKRQHRDPGKAPVAPKGPSSKKQRGSEGLDVRLQGAGRSDRDRLARELAETRAKYKGGAPLAPESKEEAEARRKRYSLAQYAKPTAEEVRAHEEKLAVHETKKRKHMQEEADVKAEQHEYEKHGKRKIDPLAEKTVVGLKPATKRAKPMQLGGKAPAPVRTFHKPRESIEDIMKRVEHLGLDFAFPTRSVHIESMPGEPKALTAERPE